MALIFQLNLTADFLYDVAEADEEQRNAKTAFYRHEDCNGAV